MSFRSWQLYGRSLRYLSWKQVGWRLVRGFRYWRARLMLPFTRDRLHVDAGVFRDARCLLERAAAAGGTERVSLEDLRAFRFTYLNQTAEQTGALPWDDPALPKLWRYQLHGFRGAREFAMAVFSDKHLGDRDRALYWMRDWMAHNPPGRGVGWHGWPLCERLLAWALLMAAYQIREEDILQSWAQQARWLSHTVEYDLQGNHLFKNALVLTLAGELLEDASLYGRGVTLLEKEVKKQILADGGHVERSLLYHNEVLWDSLIVLSLLKERPAFFVEAVQALVDFTAALRHPDGDIPLFGDAVFRESPHPSVLLTCAEQLLPPRERKVPGPALEASGYYLLGDAERGALMIIKTAEPSPSYQPGHSHGDMLSYELSLFGKRFIIDTGTHGYGESPYRAQCRSTAAHNTVQRGEDEQAEHWKSFRVARRGRALPARVSSEGERLVFEGAAAWYQGGRHERQISFSAESFSWEISDCISGIGESDSFTSRIHFHPSCEVVWIEEKKRLEVSREDVRMLVEIDDSSGNIHEARVESFYYFPEFGKKLSASVLTLRFGNGSCCQCGYRIQCCGLEEK